MPDLLRFERLALFLLACLPFLPALRGGFVYDDVPLVQEDPRVQQGDWVGALTQPYWGERHGGLYRPVTTLSFVLGARVTPAPWFCRLTNLALHGAATLLAYALARRLLGARAPALFAAALFAVHPIHTEVAANGVGRAESLAFLLTGAAWLVVLDDAHRVRPRRLAPAALLACLGVLAKESAFVLALSAPLEVLFFAARPRARQALRATAPALVALAVGLGARAAALGPALLPPALVESPFGLRLANAPVLLFFYLGNMLWPVALSPDYGGTLPLVEHALSWATLLWWLAAAAVLLALAWLGGRRALFAGVFFVLALAPVLQLVPIGTLAGDRLAYTASFGFVLGLGLLFEAGLRRCARLPGGGVRAWGPVAALLLGWLALTSAPDAHAWSDPVRLFERARERTPRSSQIPYVLGALHARRGEHAEAIPQFESALALDPSSAKVWLQLGQARAELGQLVEARAAYERAFALGLSEGNGLEESGVRVQLGLVYLRLGELEGARREFARAADLAPEDGDILLRLGQVQERLGQPDEARRSLERGLALGALDEVKGRAQLGLLLSEQGDLAGAEREWRRLTELEPGVGLWFQALGEVLQRRGDAPAARAALERSLALDPSGPRAAEIQRRLAKLP